MLFGLTNAPTTFQSYMNHVSNKLLSKFLLFFFDDMLIYGRNWEDHLRHLDKVLGILEEKQLYAKDSKCEFGMNDMLYLGHVIGKNGVQVHQEKLKEIIEWPIPINLIELKSFLGLCTYYRKFVKGFSQLTTPLTDLTKKGAFNWKDEAQMKFEKMKQVMSSCHVLALPDIT
jgi:hypothetical protein